MNMHTNRGIFRSIGAVSVALIALAGCGNPGDVTATQQDQGEATSSTLTIWADADRVSVLKDVAEQFTDKTGVKVNLVQKDMGSVQQDLITQVPAGKGPDIAIGQNDWTGILATDGVIQPLELGDAESDYEKVATDAFNYNGKIYALPYAIENVALVRNTKLAPQAPTTWDDMVATAKSVGAEYPYLLQVGDQGDSYTMYPIQTSFGSFVFGQRDDGSYDSSKLTIGDENGVKFAQWVQQQAQNGTLSTSMSADIALSKFEQGHLHISSPVRGISPRYRKPALTWPWIRFLRLEARLPSLSWVLADSSSARRLPTRSPQLTFLSITSVLLMFSSPCTKWDNVCPH